jgi:hypothetical protein
MNEDIVELLRTQPVLTNPSEAIKLMNRAADEIERLCKEHDRLVNALRNAKEGVF